MKNPTYRIKQAWFNLLNGQIGYNSQSVTVTREEGGKLPPSHYVIIRSGGSRREPVDQFMRRVTILIQVVTKFSSAEGVDDGVVEFIDEQISNKALPTFVDDALTDGADFQVTMVSNEEDFYETFEDTDKSIKYHVKTTRWEHLAVEK